jgi:hypothetical protein
MGAWLGGAAGAGFVGGQGDRLHGAIVGRLRSAGKRLLAAVRFAHAPNVDHSALGVIPAPGGRVRLRIVVPNVAFLARLTECSSRRGRASD